GYAGAAGGPPPPQTTLGRLPRGLSIEPRDFGFAASLAPRRYGSWEAAGPPPRPSRPTSRPTPYLAEFLGGRSSLSTGRAGQGWGAASGDPYLARKISRRAARLRRRVRGRRGSLAPQAYEWRGAVPGWLGVARRSSPRARDRSCGREAR